MNRLVTSMFLVLAWAFLAYAHGATSIAPATLAQGDPSVQPAGGVRNLPADTAIIAKLVTAIDTSQCKPGDRVEAEITHEVKAGHDKLVERGGHVIGQVTKAVGPDANGRYGVWIVFDKVAVKHGDPLSLKMGIQAISGPVTGDLVDGMTVNGIPRKQEGATEGPHGELTEKSSGVIGLPGLTLMNGIANGSPLTLLASKGKIYLMKGSQVVFRVANP